MPIRNRSINFDKSANIFVDPCIKGKTYSCDVKLKKLHKWVQFFMPDNVSKQ